MSARSDGALTAVTLWLLVVFGLGETVETDWVAGPQLGATMLLGFVTGRPWALAVPVPLAALSAASVLLSTDSETAEPITVVGFLALAELAITAGMAASTGALWLHVQRSRRKTSRTT